VCHSWPPGGAASIAPAIGKSAVFAFIFPQVLTTETQRRRNDNSGKKHRNCTMHPVCSLFSINALWIFPIALCACVSVVNHILAVPRVAQMVFHEVEMKK